MKHSKQNSKLVKKILAIDIGLGTQDVLLYDSSKNIENCISLILPSPTAFYGDIIKNSSCDLYIHGNTIGGGFISSAIKEHIKRGYRVIMSPAAAASIRDNLEAVKHLGIIIGKPDDDFMGEKIFLKEINFLLLRGFLSKFSEAVDVDAVAIAVQDHGTSSEGKSDRAFRFEIMQDRLRKNNSPENFAYWPEEVPPYFTRMCSVIKTIKKDFSGRILVMDTALSAILGSAENVSVPRLIVNVGNQHTLCALVKNDKIDAIMEHHTQLLSPEKIRKLILRFAEGELSGEEIFRDGGHGAVYINKYKAGVGNNIIVTGPNRRIMHHTGLPVTFAAPAGNMMLTGAIGLVKAYMAKTDQGFDLL